MKDRKSWKKALSVLLSTAMVVGLIGVAGPKPVKAADPEANVLTNGDFEDASNASWKDQDGKLVGAQEVVDDVTVHEIVTNGDFEAGNYQSGVNGWQGRGGADLSVIADSTDATNKVLQVVSTAGGAQANFYLGKAGILEVGKKYTVSFDVKQTGGNGGFTKYSDSVVGGWTSHEWEAPSSKWRTIEYDIIPTKSTAWAQIGIQFDAAATFCIDNFSIAWKETKMENVTGDIVENGDFEAGNYQSGVNGWQSRGGADLSVIADSTDATNKVLQVVSTAGGAQANFYLGKAGILEVGKKYTVSFDVKQTGGNGGFTKYSDSVVGGWTSHEWEAPSSKWRTIEYDIIPTKSTAWAQIGIQFDAAATFCIDNFSITYDAGTQVAKTYTEGIGTCKDAEPDNVLAMKDYTKVTQEGTIKKGNRYDYSFMVKSENAGEDLAFGVTAGDNATVPVTVTSEWKKVTGFFTATSDATEFGFTRGGTGTVLVDDVVLNETAVGPSNHTSMAGGGAYVQEGQINTLKTGNWNFSSDDLTGYTSEKASMEVVNQTLKIGVNANGGYVQLPNMPVEADVEYTFSCYVQVQDATGDLAAAIYHITAAGLEWNNFVCNLPTGNTDEWQLFTFTFTPSESGDMQFGFINRNAETATIYVDDIALTRNKPVPTDHTSQGGAYIPEGNVSVYSSDMSTTPEGLGSLDFDKLGGTITDGMMKLPFTTKQYVPISVRVTGNVTYTLSYYVWVEDAEAGKFDFNIYYTGAGIEWIDWGAVSIQEDTNGWVKIENEVTPKITGTLQIGFENYGSGAGTVYLDDICLSAAPTGEATEISFTYDTTKGYNFHYEQENRLYMGSTGTTVKNLRGDIVINGTTKEITYQHYNGGVVVLFDGLLGTDKVNEITIPKGTILWDGFTKVYEIAEKFTIYTQRVAEGQWMTWQNEYPLEQKVQYFDMGTSNSEYTFNNNPTSAYQGVVTVTKPDNTKVVLGGTSANQSTVEKSTTVQDTGDYLVSKVIQGEKYDYTVALYKRGDADSTMDGVLNSKDLVAAKKAVSADKAMFGYARYKAADSNTDGVVNEEDAAFMRHILAGDYDITTTTSKGYSTLGQGVMPIVGYGGPSDHTCKQNNDATARSLQGGIDNLLDGEFGEQTFELVKDLGINVFSSDVHEVGDHYDISSRMLKMAEKYGIGVYLNNGYIRNDPSGQISLQTAKYENFGSFYGYYVADEPTKSEISDFTTTLGTLKNKVNIASYFNMLPISDVTFQLGGDYTSYLNTAAATGAETISYDLYLRAKNGNIRAKNFYQNLDEARTASMKASKPFQAFVQTGANWIDKSSDSVSDSNRLTIQEMYLEANAALAMGAKGIHYFTLIESANQVAAGDNYSGLITINGEANNNEDEKYAYYDAAKKINTYIAKVDEVLMNATSKGVITTNSKIQSYMSGENTNLTSYGAVTSVTGTNAFVGCFDYYGKNAYMVVNTSTSASETITLNMADTITYTYTGMDCASHTGSGTLILTGLGAGESVLVVVD